MTPFRLAVALSALLLAGCKNNDIPDEIASIFVEASPTSGGSMRQEVRLPVSQITITVMTRPLVPAEEILNTEALTSGEPDLRQEFLLVQLDRKAAIDVMNYTTEAIGRHFVLVINDAAVGIMPSKVVLLEDRIAFAGSANCGIRYEPRS